MNLVQKRVRVAKVTITCMIVVLVVLVVVRIVSEHKTSLRPFDMFFQVAFNQQRDSTGVCVDPFGISSDELRFEYSSDDSCVVWYSSAENKTYSQLLVNQALCSQGWITYVDDGQVLDNYLRYQPRTNVLEYILVLYYEHATGCEIIIEMM